MNLYYHKDHTHAQPCCYKNGMVTKELVLKDLISYLADNLRCEFCQAPHSIERFKMYQQLRSLRIKDYLKRR